MILFFKVFLTEFIAEMGDKTQLMLIAFTVCVWIFAGSKKKIGRVEGFCMVALYAVYAVYIIIR